MSVPALRLTTQLCSVLYIPPRCWPLPSRTDPHVILQMLFCKTITSAVHRQRCIPLAAFILMVTAPLQFHRRPLPLQAREARVITRIAVVRAVVGLGWDAAGRRASWRRQLGRAAPVGSFAAIELLRAGPSFHPLQRVQIVVTCVAVERARRRHGCRWW